MTIERLSLRQQSTGGSLDPGIDSHLAKRQPVPRERRFFDKAVTPPTLEFPREVAPNKGLGTCLVAGHRSLQAIQYNWGSFLFCPCRPPPAGTTRCKH